MIFEETQRVTAKVGAEPFMLPAIPYKCEKTFSFYDDCEPG